MTPSALGWQTVSTLSVNTHTQVFDSLHREQPAVFEKLLPVAGDLMEPGLGLSENDQQLLIQNVAVVFHLAATIKFDAPLRWEKRVVSLS